MVYATLEQSIVALQQAESALQSTIADIRDRIDQGYVKEMKGNEVTKVNAAFNSIESVLNELNKTRSRFEIVRNDFKKLTT